MVNYDEKVNGNKNQNEIDIFVVLTTKKKRESKIESTNKTPHK